MKNNKTTTLGNFLLIAAEWDSEKNGALPTTTLELNLKESVGWRCNTCNSTWQMSINSRLKGIGCPSCSRRNKRLKQSVAETHPHLLEEFHPNKNHNLTLHDFSSGSSYQAWWICDKGHEYQSRVFSKVAGTGCPYCTNKKILIGFNDLATTHPQLASELRAEQDEDITPQNITHASRKKAWWVCSTCGHEWKAILHDRSCKNSGCPKCARTKPHLSRNSTVNTHPMLLKEWHPTRNGEITPHHVGRYSNRVIWWICMDKHDWQSSVPDRLRGSSCPDCPNSHGLTSKEIRAATRERIALEWHPTKNACPDMNIANPKMKDEVWWICKHGHEWSAKFGVRMTGVNCPYCCGRLATSETCLATVNPALAAELHPNKNGGLLASEIVAKSSRKLWWQCSECNYEWEAILTNRMQGKCGCPKCRAKTRLPLAPHLIQELHPTKNAGIDMEMLTAKSNSKIWWMCERGHEWQSRVFTRTVYNTSCPCCSKETHPSKTKVA